MAEQVKSLRSFPAFITLKLFLPCHLLPQHLVKYESIISLVQLVDLANQHNIYGVSITRKAELQQLLRSKLPPEYWSGRESLVSFYLQSCMKYNIGWFSNSCVKENKE